MKTGSATSLPLTVCDSMIDGKWSLDHVLGRLGQVDELVGELRRPDDVGLVDVDVGVLAASQSLYWPNWSVVEDGIGTMVTLLPVFCSN